VCVCQNVPAKIITEYRPLMIDRSRAFAHYLTTYMPRPSVTDRQRERERERWSVCVYLPTTVDDW